MTSRTTISMLTLVVLMILLLAGGDAWAKDQVERPFMIQGSSQAVISLADYSFEGEGAGVATHCGQIAWAAQGILNESGTCAITAANGDQIFGDFWPDNTVTFTGGAGRFEGATGGFTYVAEMVGDPVVDPSGETMTVKYSWTGTGTIKY